MHVYYILASVLIAISTDLFKAINNSCHHNKGYYLMMKKSYACSLALANSLL